MMLALIWVCGLSVAASIGTYFCVLVWTSVK